MTVATLEVQEPTSVTPDNYGGRVTRLDDTLAVVIYADVDTGTTVFVRALRIDEPGCVVTVGEPVEVQVWPQSTATWDAAGMSATTGVMAYIDYINVPPWQGPPIRTFSAGDGVARTFTVDPDTLEVTLGDPVVWRTAILTTVPARAAGLPVETTDWPISVKKFSDGLAVVGHLDYDFPNRNMLGSGSLRQKVTPLTIAGSSVTAGTPLTVLSATGTIGTITRPAQVMALSETKGAFADLNYTAPNEMVVTTFSVTGGVLAQLAQTQINNGTSFAVREPWVVSLSSTLLLMAWEEFVGPIRRFYLQVIDVSGTPVGGPIQQVTTAVEILQLVPLNDLQAVAFTDSLLVDGEEAAVLLTVDPVTYVITLSPAVELGPDRGFASSRQYAAKLAEDRALIYTSFSSFVIGACAVCLPYDPAVASQTGIRGRRRVKARRAVTDSDGVNTTAEHVDDFWCRERGAVVAPTVSIRAIRE